MGKQQMLPLKCVCVCVCLQDTNNKTWSVICNVKSYHHCYIIQTAPQDGSDGKKHIPFSSYTATTLSI